MTDVGGITGRLNLVVGDGEIDLGTVYLPLTLTRVSSEKPPYLGIGVDLEAVRDMVTELFRQAEAVDHDRIDHAAEALLPTDTYGPGRVIAAEFSRGRDTRTGNCANCTCECHDDDPLPPGVYITVKLDSNAGVYLGRRVMVTEVAAALGIEAVDHG